MSEQVDRQAADETAVRSLYEQVMAGWNQASGAAFAAPFLEDADFVAFDGTHFRGRTQIETFHQELFDKYLKGSRLVGEVRRVRFLGPDAAVLHAVGGTILRGKARPARERDSIQTLVAVRSGDDWRLAAFQNTRIRPLRNARTFLVTALGDRLWRLFRLTTDPRPPPPPPDSPRK